MNAESRSIESQCKSAFDVSTRLGIISTDDKNKVLSEMSVALIAHQDHILAENKKDVEFGRESGLSTALIDRLSLDASRIKGMADSLLVIRDLADPIGDIINQWTIENGLEISKIRVPFGVIGIIYEARPNVTVDAIGLALKSGNCVVLRGSKSARHSNKVISDVLRDVLIAHEMPGDSIQLLDDTTHDGVTTLVQMKQYLGLVIPRGGAKLIQRVVETATVPAIETGVGNCHVYVDSTADLDKALDICVNAKTHRPSVCNACEGILIHKDIVSEFLPRLASALLETNVDIRGCDQTCAIVPDATPATESDWGEEFLDLIVSIKVVDSLDAALGHIGDYGSLHTEAIVSEDPSSIDRFLNEVDAACVIVNASTRFTDGGVFGFGAEMGISTQKLHARGPMGLSELTTYKYVVRGNGQVR